MTKIQEINMLRQALDELAATNEACLSEGEILKLSQEMDELISGYYLSYKKRKPHRNTSTAPNKYVKG